MDLNKYKEKIREIENFPIPGVNFRDITPVLADGRAFKEIIDAMVDFFRDKKIDKVLGIDARGFLFSSAVAYELGVGMAIVRKKGKLPHRTITTDHPLEYGKGTMEIHVDAVGKGERVAIVDDVLATGGTADAAVKLVEQLGGEVAGLAFLLEIRSFGGRKKLEKYPIRSLIVY